MNLIIIINDTENEEFLANQIGLLLKSTPEALIKDEIASGCISGQNGLLKPNFQLKSVPGHMNPQQNQNNVKLMERKGSRFSKRWRNRHAGRRIKNQIPSISKSTYVSGSCIVSPAP